MNPLKVYRFNGLFTELGDHRHDLNLEHFYRPPPQRNLVPVGSHCTFPAASNLLSVCKKMPILDISSKKNQNMWGFVFLCIWLLSLSTMSSRVILSVP